MKPLVLFMWGSLLACTPDTYAQQTINGGFEPASAITPCSDMPLATYNTKMGGGNRAIGGRTTIQLADVSCGQGNPVKGSHFVVLKYDPPYGNDVILKLDKPMTANKQYSVKISYKVPVGIPPATAFLRCGYSKDSTTADSFVTAIGPVTTETWKEDTVIITPKLASQFIWIELTTLGGDLYTIHVDNVEMLNVAGGVDDTRTATSFNLFPNPSKGKVLVSFDKNISMPCTIRVYNITGKTISTADNVTDNKCQLDISGVSPGMYFVQLTDKQQRVYSTRLQVD